MNISLQDVVLILLLPGACYWWWQSLGVKDRVMVQARRYCKQLGYQLLDQTLVFRGWRLVRDGNRKRLCRHYTFDISTNGKNRFSGEVSVWRKHVVRILLDTDDHTDISDYPLQ